jgi:energy-converting hydrogenase A subunit A
VGDIMGAPMFNDLIYYGVAIVVSIIIGLLLRLPLKIDIDSFEANAIFPPVFIALGLCALVEFLFSSNLIMGIIIGFISALFSKYSMNIFSGVDYGSN